MLLLSRRPKHLAHHLRAQPEPVRKGLGFLHEAHLQVMVHQNVKGFPALLGQRVGKAVRLLSVGAAQAAVIGILHLTVVRRTEIPFVKLLQYPFHTSFLRFSRILSCLYESGFRQSARPQAARPANSITLL